MPPAKPKPNQEENAEAKLLRELAALGVSDAAQVAQIIERSLTIEQVEANIAAGLPPAFREWQDPVVIAQAERRDELRAQVAAMLAALPETKRAVKILMSRSYFGDFFGEHAFAPDGRARMGFEQHGLEVECVDGLTDEFFIVTVDVAPPPNPDICETEGDEEATRPDVPSPDDGV